VKGKGNLLIIILFVNMTKSCNSVDIALFYIHFEISYQKPEIVKVWSYRKETMQERHLLGISSIQLKKFRQLNRRKAKIQWRQVWLTLYHSLVQLLFNLEFGFTICGSLHKHFKGSHIWVLSNNVKDIFARRVLRTEINF
jgi:hypothetical protein